MLILWDYEKKIIPMWVTLTSERHKGNAGKKWTGLYPIERLNKAAEKHFGVKPKTKNKIAEVKND